MTAGRVAEAGDISSGAAWPAIFAGAFAAAAATLVLLALGSGFGLSVASPWRGSGVSITTFSVAAAIWLVVLHWLSSGIGGYLTGRLRTKWAGLHTDEVFFRDTANGFIMWAVATVGGAAILAMATIATLGGAAAAATDVASGAANGYVLDTLFRVDHVTTTDAEVKAQSGRILVNAIRTGDMPKEDRTYLADAIAAGTGIAPAEAAKRVDTAMADVQITAEKARKALDAVRATTARVSIFTAIAMLVGAFVACIAAALGGRQRDEY